MAAVDEDHPPGPAKIARQADLLAIDKLELHGWEIIALIEDLT